MKRKNCSPLRMADGGVVPARPVSPYSIRGIANTVGDAYTGAVDATSQMMENVARPFSRPPGYTPATVSAPAPALAPVAAPAVAAAPRLQLGGLNLDVIRRREAAAGLRDGAAFLQGPGGPTDDKIPAKLSRGEAVLPADTVQAIGPHNVQALIDSTHTPVKPKGLRHFANGIAGIDVTETPFTESDARLFGQRPPGTVTPPNPSVPGMEVHEPFGPQAVRPVGPQPSIPGIEVGYGETPAARAPLNSPEAQAFRASRAAPTVTPTAAPAAAEAAGAGGAAYRAGSAVARGLRAAGPAMVAGEVLSNFGDHKIAPTLDPVDSSAAGTLRYLGKGDFGGAWDSLKKGAVETGMDVATGLAGVGDTFLPGTPLRDALETRFKSDLGSGVQTPAPAPARNAGGGRGFVNPAAVNPGAAAPTASPTAPPLDNSVLPGGVQRRGNSFTNTGRFIEDERAGAGPNAQNSAAADALSTKYTAQARAGLRGGMDENLPAGYGATIPASQSEAELAARNDSVRSTIGGAGNVSPRTRVAMEANALRAKEMGMQDATTRRGQDLNASTANEGHKVSLRGQDLSYAAQTRGQDMTARTAAVQARLEQMNKDRSYQFDREKHGDELAKQRFEMREAAQKNMHEQVANLLPPGADGKPDMANAARYMTGLNGMVAEQQRVLESKARGGDARAAAALEDLHTNGVGALDPTMVRNFVQGMKVNDLRAQYGTSRFNPVGGTDVITDKPAAGLRKSSNGVFGLGGEYTAVGPNGENLGTIPARAVEGDGSFFGGKRRTDLRDFVR